MKTEQVNYSTKTFPELLALAMSGDRGAAAEIAARQEAQQQEIELLKVKVSSKRKPAVEKTPEDLFAEKTYYRAAKLLAAFGAELNNKEQLAAMVVCNIMLGVTSLATGNLRQACDRARQCAAGSKAEIELNSNIPVLAKHLQHMIPDENLKLDQQTEQTERLIFAVKFFEYANVQEEKKKDIFMAFWDMYIQGTTGAPEYIEALKNAIAAETPAEGGASSEFLLTMQAELKAAEEKKAATNKKAGAKK